MARQATTPYLDNSKSHSTSSVQVDTMDFAEYPAGQSFHTNPRVLGNSAGSDQHADTHHNADGKSSAEARYDHSRDEEHSLTRVLSPQLKNLHESSDKASKAESREGPPWADKDAQILLINHESKQCLAILLNETISYYVNQIRPKRYAVERKQQELRNSISEEIDIEERLEEAEIRLQEVEDPQEAGQVRNEIKALKQELSAPQTMKQKYTHELDPLKDDLDFSRQRSEEFLENVFEQAGLLDPLPSDAEYSDEESIRSEQVSKAPSDDASVEPSSEELIRRTAMDELYQSLAALRGAEARFHGRHGDYERELANYDQLKLEGNVSYARIDFDCLQVKHVSRRTRELTKAEMWHKEAKIRARNMGVQEPLYYQTSDFGDMKDDGYRESQEAESMQEMDRRRVERWRSDVIDSQTLYAVGDADPAPATADPDIIPISQPNSGDNWEAKTIGLADSGSVIDTERYCGKIKGWNQHCSELRERLRLTPAYDLSAPETQSPYRRRLC